MKRKKQLKIKIMSKKADEKIDMMTDKLFKHQKQADKILNKIYELDEQSGEEISELLRDEDY